MSGGSTYVVSLPKKWVQRANLKAGDSVVVTEQDGSLIIMTSIPEKEAKVKEIKISELMSSEALERIIIALYLTGYDTIRIRFDRKESHLYRMSIRNILGYLVGVEIVDDSEERIILEVMVDYSRMRTKQILRRMYSINRSMLLDLSKALKNEDTVLVKDIVEREHEIDRLYFLVVRQLKGAVEYPQLAQKLGIENQKDCLGYRIVVKVLERIGDHIENIGRSYIKLVLLKKKTTLQEFIMLNTSIAQILENAMDSFFARNHAQAEKIFQHIKEIKIQHSTLSNELLKQADIQAIILKKTMIDSLERIIGYIEDLIEISINMSVETLFDK